MSPSTTSQLEPGFCILHANHLEDLTAVLVDWVQANPLDPLADEVFLVQSNGMAQWLKLALADDDACGIAAAQDFQLPSAFLWRAYRSVLGEAAVPATSPFDKTRLLWRLMAHLPGLLTRPTFTPLQRFLHADDDLRRRYQLAARLADLYDQYQVYRADWLAAWEDGDDRIFRSPGDAGVALTASENAWQAELWRELIATLPAAASTSSRAHVHRRFVEALQAGPAPSDLPARIVVFGLSSLPAQMLEALYALSPHCQILMMVQNPCRHYWGDIIEDKELLRRQQSRHAPPSELQHVPDEEQHRHANPLLAAWGKQGRDYIGLLYDYDAPEAYQQRFRQIDLFTDPAHQHQRPESMLAAIQQAVFELEPAPASPEPRVPDPSIRFQRAHSPQREVEILHDHVLAALEESANGTHPARPRDFIVMVPDIETYAPHIDAVFGNVSEGDPRHIPYSIADRSQLQTQPLAAALQRLLELPGLRFTPGDLLDLLEAPALRRRFGIDATDLPVLHDWVDGAGIRWGLHAEQRASLDLPAGFEQNSWWFGLRRMLLGYAVGTGEAWQEIEPYAEVGGLEATLAGRLVALVDTLDRHWRILGTPATPATWITRVTELMADLFIIDGQDDLQLQATLFDTLEEWQGACDEVDFTEALPLAVAREAWIGTLDQASLSQRFLAGRVNFCTLMPMRSIPFRHVCLLGMNDGDYPRSQPPQDFDLMTRPGQYRPGDRSRRDDDRYLFLEAVLAAREQLYISWVGRDIRDNESRPPSVLVAQLRDHIDACWTATSADGAVEPMLPAITQDHPLQPFSQRYFQQTQGGATHWDAAGLFTYAHEWRAAHTAPAVSGDNTPLPLPAFDAPLTLTPLDLARLLRDPPAHFLQQRLKVHFPASDPGTDDSEPFALDGLGEYQVQHELITAVAQAPADDQPAALARASAALKRAGWLPAPPFDQYWVADLENMAAAAGTKWHALREQFPHSRPLQELRWTTTQHSVDVAIEHWLDDVRADTATAEDGTRLLRLRMVAGRIQGRPDKARDLWVDHLLACACGVAIESRLVAGDACLVLAPLDADAAGGLLEALVDAWLAGLCQPLPLALRTGFAFAGKKAQDATDAAAFTEARKKYDSSDRHTGEVDYAGNTALRRCFPTFAELTAAMDEDKRDFAYWAERLYQPLVEHHAEDEVHA